MKDVAVKWKDVGIQLLRSGNTLDIIEKSYHNVSKLYILLYIAVQSIQIRSGKINNVMLMYCYLLVGCYDMLPRDVC